MLTARALPLLLLLVNSAALGHTFEVGTYKVIGACVTSDFANRATLPWQSQRPTLVRRDGVQAVSVLVLPTKSHDEQTPAERSALERCAKAAGRESSPEGRTTQTTETEAKLAGQVNACLRQAGTGLTVSFATIKRGEISCLEGGAPR